MKSVVHLFTYQEKTAFIPLKYIYPECNVLIDGEPQLSPLICLKENCHRNANCMEVLAKRVLFIFEELETAQLLLVYFKVEASIKAGVFTRDMDEPRIITCNKSAFLKFQTNGQILKWIPPTDYWLTAADPKIISARDLIREH